MIDGGPSSELPEDSSQHEDLPDRLRVHSLARALGTTSKRVLEALTELDGRIRSAHSTVDRVDAVRVRDLLGGAPVTAATAVVATEAEAAAAVDEPESRLMLAAPDTGAERPEYMPLFVAPQPVARGEDVADADDSADSDDDDLDSDDDEQGERPANRRRRRGRRGRGRGRGEQNGADKGDEAGGDGGTSDESDAASADNADAKRVSDLIQKLGSAKFQERSAAL